MDESDWLPEGVSLGDPDPDIVAPALALPVALRELEELGERVGVPEAI